MAIINSAGIGKSTKSQGNLTYKYVRGRTIASSRITENKSNTPRQGIARMQFAALSGFVVRQAAYIDLAFDKSKYGSSRNTYMTVNKRLLTELSYLNSYISGETSLYAMLGVWFGGPADSPMPYVAFGTAPALAVGTLNEGKKTFKDITFSFGAGVLLQDLEFGDYTIKEDSVSLTSPKSFADAGGVGSQVVTGGSQYTLTFTDDTNTIVSSIKCISSNADSNYHIPILRIKGKNVKVTAPLLPIV